MKPRKGLNRSSESLFIAILFYCRRELSYIYFQRPMEYETTISYNIISVVFYWLGSLKAVFSRHYSSLRGYFLNQTLGKDEQKSMKSDKQA